MKYIKAQMTLMLKRQSFSITLTATVLLSIWLFFTNCLSVFGSWDNSVPAAKYMFLGSFCYSDQIPMIFSLIIPIIATLPFADSFFEEREKSTIEYSLIRCNINSYYYSKLFTVFFSGAIVMFVPLIINYLLNFISFPIDSDVDFTMLSSDQTWIHTTLLNRLVMFKELLIKSPYVYLLLHTLLFSIAGGLMAVVSFQISFFYNKSRAIFVCLLFIIYHIYSIVLQGFGMYEFVFTSYVFAYSSSSSQSITGAAVTWSALTLAAFLPIPFAKRKLENINA